MEMRYKFPGMADSVPMQPAQPCALPCCRMIGCAAMLSLAALVVMSLMGGPVQTSTTMAEQQFGISNGEMQSSGQQFGVDAGDTPPPITGECTFWGDPHVKTFDGGSPGFYGEGEFYIVKSDTVIIQGRYMGTSWTAGLAATNSIAVGGPFLAGHVIVVGCLDAGDITVDDKSITEFPSTYRLPDVDSTISYGAEGNVVDNATSSWEKHVVNMSLPLGVRLEVFRWSNYLDLRLTMSRQPNQDGSCSNFNGDAADDTTELIFSRIGARVPRGELLFKARAPLAWTDTEEKLLGACPDATKARARTECRGDLALSSFRGNPSQMEMNLCMLDICYGKNAHTLSMAKDLGFVPASVAE